MSSAQIEPGATPLHPPPTRVRVVTAASLFDGHDAAINIMRRLLQQQGASEDAGRWWGHGRGTLTVGARAGFRQPRHVRGRRGARCRRHGGMAGMTAKAKVRPPSRPFSGSPSGLWSPHSVMTRASPASPRGAQAPRHEAARAVCDGGF